LRTSAQGVSSKFDPTEAPVTCPAAPEPTRWLCDPPSAPPPAGRFAFRFAFLPFFPYRNLKQACAHVRMI
jgi:hypothetical protein